MLEKKVCEFYKYCTEPAGQSQNTLLNKNKKKKIKRRRTEKSTQSKRSPNMIHMSFFDVFYFNIYAWFVFFDDVNLIMGSHNYFLVFIFFIWCLSYSFCIIFSVNSIWARKIQVDVLVCISIYAGFNDCIRMLEYMYKSQPKVVVFSDCLVFHVKQLDLALNFKDCVN